MATNYEAMGEIFQAKGTLKSLIENFPLQHIRDKAKEQLKRMEDVERKKEAQVNQDTTENRKN